MAQYMHTPYLSSLFFGHVMRADGLEKEMMLTHGEGKRERGRPRRRWMEEIHKTTGMKLEKLRKATRDRETWRELLRMVTRTQRVDGIQGDKVTVTGLKY